jgi:adenine-specific DNA-methyltransferase
MNEEKNTPDLPLGLYWKGKCTTVDRTVLPFQNLEVIETINESRASREAEKGTMFRDTSAKYLTKHDVGWRNKLIWGDNKYAMAALLEQFAGKIDLIYIDPPFATGADFSTSIKIGDNNIEYIKEASAIEELAYRDTWGKGLDSFLQMMYDRLYLMRELLSEKGSIYVHIDYRVSAHIKILMDEIFGANNFLNEIIWCYKEREMSKDKWNRKHDNILYYAKKEGKHQFNFNEVREEYTEATLAKFKYQDDNGFYQIRGKGIPGSPVNKADGLTPAHEIKYPGMTYRQYKEAGTLPRDWWVIPIVNKAANERTDYPTQKPESLLERIVKASSNEGDIVADFFCGSGTTATVAEKLGRKWITSDLGRYAIHTTRKRLLEIEGCRPFEILNIGKYERQYWQTTSFGKKSREQTLAEYVAFVLSLYKAHPLPGSAHIHGQKGTELVHIGSVEAPVTLEDVQKALGETQRMRQKQLTVLGWEWEMGLHDVVEKEAEKSGIKLKLLNIPREVMDRRAVDAGDVQFFELAYLETEVKKDKHFGYKVILKDFVIPNLDLVPKEVRDKVKKWSDFIDYWSVDWNYQGDTFHNMWQAYRTKKDRKLILETDPYQYPVKGPRRIMVKVIDIFGNDTTQIIDLNVE